MALGFRGANRVWLTVAGLCVALLLLPALALFILPRVGHVAAHAAAPPTIPLKLGSNDETEPEAVEAPVDAKADDPKGTIEGLVVDPDGNPVGGARVSCAGTPPEFATTTNDDGTFRLPAGAEGCVATASHQDFARSGEDRLYHARPNHLHLNAGGAIEGHVVDQRGAAITAFSIGIETFSSTDPTALPRPRALQQFSSPTGAFKLEKLIPGRYVLSAGVKDRPPAHGDPIEVGSGRVVRDVKLVVPLGSSFSGRVVDAETKKPVAGAVVQFDAVSDSQPLSVAPATTDARGAFALTSAPPGPFSISVSHDDYRRKIVPGLTTGFGAPPSVEVELNPKGDGGNQLELSGVGIRIGPVPGGKLRAYSVEADGPAATAGVEVQDVITLIDGVDVSTLTISECTQRLRGPPGSTVVVTVERPTGPTPLTITRAEIVTNF